MEFLVRKGYAVYHMRYRGTWESKGEFLKKSPHEDVLDVIESISEKDVFLVGSSFAGPAMLLASSKATKVIAVSPVVSWSAPSREEPLPEFKRMMKKFYSQVYRGSWTKLGRKGFYEPTGNEDGSKIFILHAKDDGVVRLKEVAQFAKKTGSKIKILKTGGHLSTSRIMKPALWKQISKFLKTR